MSNSGISRGTLRGYTPPPPEMSLNLKKILPNSLIKKV